jgi:hypothetical protein
LLLLADKLSIVFLNNSLENEVGMCWKQLLFRKLIESAAVLDPERYNVLEAVIRPKMK